MHEVKSSSRDPPNAKIPTTVIHLFVSDLPGLLLLVVLAVHSAADHQTTWKKLGKWGIQEKEFQWTLSLFSLVVCGLGRVEYSQICKIRLLAAFYHFGASWKAAIARCLTLEQSQIEHWSWWQNWPISCALQLCCWVEELKTSILGSRPAITKM